MEVEQGARPGRGTAEAQAGSPCVKTLPVPSDLPKTPSCEEVAPATFEQLGEDEEADEAQTIEVCLDRRSLF